VLKRLEEIGLSTPPCCFQQIDDEERGVHHHRPDAEDTLRSRGRRVVKEELQRTALLGHS
jgi:hypothetical protein